MAKQLKTIKCPQCGSVQKTEVKTDHYRCDSCGTEYILDSDDVNVNVRHSFDTPHQTVYQPEKTNTKRVFTILAIVLGAMFILPTVILRMFMFGGMADSSSLNSDKHYYYVYENTPVVIDGKAWIACFSKRSSYNYNQEDEWVYFFYDVENDSVKNMTEIEGIGEHDYSEMRCFADGNCYLVVNERFVFRLNKQTMQFEDYLPHILHVKDEFNAGVASVEISSDWEGDAFEIMSNIGDEYAYFPIADRVYTDAERNRAEDGMNTLLPGARDSTFYMFNEETPIQLIKVNFKYNAGGPFSHWQMTSNWNGYRQNKGRYRVVSYSDATPGRRWFDPYVAYQGQDDLLVSVRANAAEDSQISLQKIDTTTGEVVWATPVRIPDRRSPWLTGYMRESIRVGDQYIIKDDTKVYLVLGADGSLIKEIDLNFR